MLNAPLDERTWYCELDLAERLVRYAALDSAFTIDLPLDPMHGTVGVAPPLGEARSSLAPGSWGGNMDTPEMRAGVTCYLGVNVERCSASATAMPGRVRARPAASPSRRRWTLS
jgi:acetamidase/formamidase